MENLILCLMLVPCMYFTIYVIRIKNKKKLNDEIIMFERRKANSLELLANAKKRTEILNEGKMKSNVKITTQSTQGPPPPPPERTRVYVDTNQLEKKM